MKVLIVEDSPILADRITEMLSEFAETIQIVGWARDAPEAFESIRELRPDIVILDLRLPTGSGLDILKQLKREEEGRKVLVLTNYAFPQIRKTCLEAGAQYFFDKSTEFDKVREAFQQMTKGSQAH